MVLVLFKVLFGLTIGTGLTVVGLKVGTLALRYYQEKTIFELSDEGNVRKCIKCGSKQRLFVGYLEPTWTTFKKTPDCSCRHHAI